MSGEADLPTLLAEMSPELDPQPYVFATTNTPLDTRELSTLMRFTEREGETLILKLEDAQRAGLSYSGEYARIILTVHSALDAVGFLAAVASALADQGISTNVVAAFYHDHLFVPLARAHDAMQTLEQLSASGRAG